MLTVALDRDRVRKFPTKNKLRYRDKHPLIIRPIYLNRPSELGNKTSMFLIDSLWSYWKCNTPASHDPREKQ